MADKCETEIYRQRAMSGKDFIYDWISITIRASLFVSDTHSDTYWAEHRIHREIARDLLSTNGKQFLLLSNDILFATRMNETNAVLRNILIGIMLIPSSVNTILTAISQQTNKPVKCVINAFDGWQGCTIFSGFSRLGMRGSNEVDSLLFLRPVILARSDAMES